MTTRACMLIALLAGCGGSGKSAPAGQGTTSDLSMRSPTDLSTGDFSMASLSASLLSLTQTCTVASNGKFATDDGVTPSVDICKLSGAFFWNSDMDVDCDGQTTPQCNSDTDPSYDDETSFTESDGTTPLDAATLPFIVIPESSSRFDLEAENIEPGALSIVLYGGKLSYGVFGDEGPADIIGEASYAMNASLGVDPDPATGGVDSGVTFFVFTGDAAVVTPIEDHDAAVTLGMSLAQQLLADN